jgi:hypothetical protein
VGYRLHGALWFVLLAVGVAGLFRRALPGPVGVLALIVFTISGIHGILSWTATRHIVIAAALGVLAVGAHMRWREQDWRPGLPLALVEFALALAASEAALGVLAYLLAYEALGAPGRLRRRVVALLPISGLVVIYLGLYVALGLGSPGSGVYFDPLHEPLRFAVELPGRLAFLLGAMCLGGGADLWVLRPDLRPGLMGLGAAVLVVMALLLRAVWPTLTDAERRPVRWLIAGAALSAIPFAGTPIGSRCLVIPLIGGAVAFAVVIQRWWTVLRRPPRTGRHLLRVACVVLAVIHLGLAPLSRLATPALLREMMSTRVATAMEEAELDAASLAGQTVVLLHAPDIAVGFHSFFYRRLHRMPMPDRWRALSWAPHAHRFHRTGADTLEMEIVDGSIEARHLRVGDVVEIDGLWATVLETGRSGPSRVEFRFDRPVDDPTMVLLAWRDGRLQRVAPPVLGESLLLEMTTAQGDSSRGRS